MKPSVQDVKAAGGIPIVYADPPWSYSNQGRGAAGNHYATMNLDAIKALPIADLASPDAVLFLWATMPLLPEALDVGRAWGFEYKTCAFTWVKYHEKSGKPAMGGGMWTRANVELCLLFVRGEPPRRVSAAVRQLVETEPEVIDRIPEWCEECRHGIVDHTVIRRCSTCDRAVIECFRYTRFIDNNAQVLRAPRGAHSAKPAEVRARIDELMGPDLPRVELFARERADGWDAWGDGVPGGSDFEMGGI